MARGGVLLMSTLVAAVMAALVVLTGMTTAASGPLDYPKGDPPQVAKLAFCGDAELRDVSRRLLYVSTLDGTLTALDVTAAGRPRWSLATGPAPLLSSSIHRFELTNDGRMVRMIPSLYGSLYKFDGDSIEQIPVTADHLLSTSYKFSEDLVISGGKETRSYGVSARTGRIVYECSMAGCRNHTAATDERSDATPRNGPPREPTIDDEQREHDPLVDDIVVVRRETQTVRAVEPRTGGERWNFSVGHHELELLKPHDCHQTRLDDEQTAQRPWQRFDAELELRVLVPEGVVCAVRRDAPTVVVWQHKFQHPIVNAWRVNDVDTLETVNLFSVQQFPVKQTTPNAVHPSVYVGMYNRQLYIQESDNLKRTMFGSQLDAINRNFLKIPWKPQYAVARIESDEPAAAAAAAALDTSVLDVTDDRTTAMSILYATEYVNGNGFFLYSSGDLNRTSLCDRVNGSSDDDGGTGSDGSYDFPFADDDTPTKIIIVSLWFWWKEIMVISLTTALILNVVLSRRLTSPREVVIVERHVEVQVPVPTAVEAIDEESGHSRRSLSESLNSDGSAFVSRYQADFDMLQCLGKGGFGVVFESKNKLDDCKYAIKRIQLPNRQESRDRVMREVKTLAHCEHQNIVRYFQAWVETPPPGWQEKEDRIWMDREAMSHSVDIESPTMDDDDEEEEEEESALLPSKRGGDHVVFSKVINRRERGLDAWITNLNTNECLNFDEDNRKTSFLNDTTGDDDSFIQFRDDSSASAAMADCSYCHEDSVFADGRKQNEASHEAPSIDIVFTDETRSKRTAAAAANKRRPDRSSRTNNDSFQIVFQNPSCASTMDQHSESDDDDDNDNDGNETTEDSVSGRPTIDDEDEDEHDDDSFRIVFQHSTNGSGDTAEHSSAAGRLPAAIKKRTFSENIVDSTSCCADTSGDGAAFGCKASRRTAAAAAPSSAAVEPFRKTHRRPLSLDLTAAANRRNNKVELFSPTRMYLYIQMQLCKKQSLKDWLRLNDLQTRQRDIVCIFRQIVDGVEYCHLKGLIHRDLKPSNIFFSLDGQIKIGDFGLVTGMSEIPNTPCSQRTACAKHTQQVGTHLYMSPEQLKGEQYSYKVDVYSLGLIFFELLRVFGTEMERIETLKALRLGVFPRDFACDFHDEYNLLKLMLSQSPDQRPTTIGIRARPPLGFAGGSPPNSSDTEWHFELPPRRRDSHISGVSQNGSSSELSRLSSVGSQKS